MKTIFTIAVFSILLSANSAPKALDYSTYQILSWEIKANEGFVPTWYKDGFVYNRKLKKRVQSYSIGFGWNDQGCRRHEAKPFLNSNGKITYNNATQLTLYEIKKYGKLHSDPLKNLALQLYSYSRGKITSGKQLGRCCGSSYMCGHKNKNVRKSHNRRRKFELALWNHDYRTINDMTSENKTKVQMLESKHK